ncbi:MAG: divergent polysaccharide deacetylase family protein, partial [Alphaproteobacteria bacterium]
MKIKGKPLPKITMPKASLRVSGLLIWRIILAAAVGACFVAAGMLWFSGGDETDTALSDGRRLVMTLATGEIKGKQLKAAEEPPPAAQQPATEDGTTPKDENPPEEPPTEEPPAETPPDETVTDATPPENTTPDETQPAETVPDESVPDAGTPDETSQPADPAADPVDLQATPPEPLPDDAAAPVPLTYDQLPAMSMPANQSDVPAVLPATAGNAPLLGAPLPDMSPSESQPADINSLLQEDSKEGKIPVVAADGTKAWKYYARPFSRNSREPMIAIVVTGLGNNSQVTQHAIGLPENVTLGFSPYSKQMDEWNKSARLTGHEVMLELPMEPVDYPSTDPGPYGLMLGQGVQENERRLRWLMSRMP